MKNDAVMNGKKVSIRPTLLVSLMGVIEDVNKAMTTDFLAAGDLIVLLGESRPELAGSTLEKILGRELAGTPTVHPHKALALYKAVANALRRGLISSLHDLSDGGLGVALAESALGGRLGAKITLDELPGPGGSSAELLFGETPSRFLASVAPDRLDEFLLTLKGQNCALIGVVVAEPKVTVDRDAETVLSVSLDRILTAWNSLEAVR